MAGSVFGLTLPDGALAAKGIGGAAGPISSVLTVSTTTAGTGADTNEDTLWTYSLPANTLSADGKGVRVTVTWTTAANGNTKTSRIYFGSTNFTARANADNNLQFRLTAEIFRTGASAETFGVSFIGTGGLSSAAVFSPAEATSGAITIKFTGQNGSPSANDLVFTSAIVEALN